MKNIALLLSYDGSNYHGWQFQKNAVSICETLRNAIERCVGHEVKLNGCGRTDAGVHAKRYVASFRSDTRIPVSRLPYAINAQLPPDIAIFNAVEAEESFHPIQSATGKEYTYYLYTGPHAIPLQYKRALHVPGALSLAAMQAAAREFVGEHDFACVRSLGTPVKSTVRTMYEFEITQEEQLYAFRMKANGFLYNMARALVGTMLYVSMGKIEDIPALIVSGDRVAAGPTLPPHGLYMTGVWYPNGMFLEDRP